MLGSANEADDAVQEAWLRLHRTEAGEIENLRGWLTTVVARVSLDMLRSRKSRREEPLEGSREVGREGNDPEAEAVLADSVGLAMLVVLEALAPAERVAFVLHDMFEVPFEEIGPIVGRTPTAARQLASRARRRVKGSPTPSAAHARQREVIAAFQAASRNGDMAALLAVLAPDIVLRADSAAVSFGAKSETRGAEAVAVTFSGRAQAARRALVGGAPGMAWVVKGQPKVAFRFTIYGSTISGIELLGDPETIASLDVRIEEE